MGKVVDFLANDKAYYSAVFDVARRQYPRRKRAYNAISLFENRDLSQELWVALLEREASGQLLNIFVQNVDDFKDYVRSLAEIIAVKGRRKVKEGCEVPISQLEDGLREKVEDLFYSTFAGDE